VLRRGAPRFAQSPHAITNGSKSFLYLLPYPQQFHPPPLRARPPPCSFLRSPLAISTFPANRGSFSENSRSNVMKRFAVLPALLLFLSMAHAQDAPSVSASATFPPQTGKDARMKALEEQPPHARWRGSTPAQRAKGTSPIEITGTIFRPASPASLRAPRAWCAVLLPSPAAAQTTQTQTFGGASGNAKLLNSGHQA